MNKYNLKDEEIITFAYLYKCIKNGTCKMSTEAEKLLRQKFIFVTPFNSYRYVQKYSYFHKKIETDPELKELLTRPLEENDSNFN